VAVVGPRTAKELALPFDNAIAKLMLVDGTAGGGVLGQRCGIRVMAREPVRCWLLSWPVVFRVEEGCLFPEAAFDFQGNNVTAPISKRIRQDFGNPRPDRMPANWLLVGERTEFQFDRAFEVVESSWLR
jgi:hypothetical protein